MAVTLRQVAAQAGVSPVVVSKVLHNRAQGVRVSEATAERVRQAAADLGYRCNVWARNFRDRQTFTIGVLHGIGFDRPYFDRGSRYFASLMDGIVDGGFKHGYSITMCPRLLGQTPEDAMADGRFDGLVWYSASLSEANRAMLRRCSVPIVLIHCDASEFENKFPTVLCDNDQGIGLAVDHLADLGHTKIALAIEAWPDNPEMDKRAGAFTRHTRRRGLELTTSIITVDRARTQLNDLLANNRFTAILACNDGLAEEIMNAAKTIGISIPDNLSIVGFDSTSFCNELRPALTSVSQPVFEMGARSIDLLVESMSSPVVESIEVMFPCGLDVRDSTSPLKNR